MRLDFLRGTTSLRRGLAALGVMAAFLFTIALADSPRLHERLHKSLGDHECAVTVFSSGACDFLLNSGPATAPARLLWAPLFFSSDLPSRATVGDFSRLEHAPPSFA